MHVAYAGGWKRLEPLWDLVIRARRVNTMLPVLEATLDAFGGIGRSSRAASQIRCWAPTRADLGLVAGTAGDVQPEAAIGAWESPTRSMTRGAGPVRSGRWAADRCPDPAGAEVPT